MLSDDDAIQLSDDSSDAGFSWKNISLKTEIDESSTSSSSTESLKFKNDGACSDSDSSIICLEEYHQYDVNASPFKKIKLEKVEPDSDVEPDKAITLVFGHDKNLLSPSWSAPITDSDSGIVTTSSPSAKQDHQTNAKFLTIKRLSKEELELLIMKQMVNAITANEKIIALEEKLENTEKLLELSTATNSKLSQEVKTLDLVLKRFLMQVQNGQVKITRPLKKTVRTVGIQVSQKTAKRAMKQALTMQTAENGELEIKKDPAIKESETNIASTIDAEMKPKESIQTNHLSKKEDGKDLNLNKVAERIEHPPLPDPSNVLSDPSWQQPPPKYFFRVTKVALSLNCFWYAPRFVHADVSVYRIWGFSKSSFSSGKWEQLAEFLPAPLPMSCQLDGSKLAERFKTSEVCCFAIRGTDIHGRDGPWSDPAFVTFP